MIMQSKRQEEFYSELINNVKEEYSQFADYQEIALKTLEAFHDVCEKNHITYFLAYGSLLGAVRDGGQIPWDYDIDVHVPFDQSVKLIEALQRDLPDGYHFITRITNKKFRTNTLKIAPKDFDPEVFHVDVFWLCGINDQNEINSLMKRASWYSTIMYYRFLDIKYKMFKRRFDRIFFYLNRIMYSIFPISLIDKFYAKHLSNRWNLGNFCTDNLFEFPFKTSWFKQRLLCRFQNGKSFYVPYNYNEILLSIYGDFHKIPSLINRKREYEYALNRLNVLARIR